MNGLKNFFATRWGIISVGLVIGILAPILQKLGNPPNIGIGYEIEKACILGAKINRFAGKLSNPDPSTQISEIVKFIPETIKLVL